MRAPGRRGRTLACVLAWTMLAASVVPARAAADSVFLEELTSPELRERLAAGDVTVLVPIGGTEQNGPHMALGKHNLRVRLLAERIARELGHAVVAPVIAYVPEGEVEPPSGHMRFTGTISVPEPVFEATLEAAARSFRRHGFRRIVLLGEHGGYQRSLQKVQARLNRQWAGEKVRLVAANAYYDAAHVDFAAELRRRGHASDEIGQHAGLLDTSLSLALAPALVRTERLKAAPSPAEGVRGDPRRASAELGQVGVEIIVRRTVEAIRAATPGSFAPFSP